MPRPTKRTPEREQRLLQALQAGNTRRAACHYAGISDETFTTWQRRDLGFLEAVKSAEADAERRMLGVIDDAAQSGTWTAAAWWLERRRSEDYGKRERFDIVVKQQVERYAAARGLDPDELLREAEKILSDG